MENYCAFSKNHACLKWLDYVITRQDLLFVRKSLKSS